MDGIGKAERLVAGDERAGGRKEVDERAGELVEGDGKAGQGK